MDKLIAEMAGSVWQVVKKEGESVKKGEEVIIMESMKMEIPIASESDGTIKEIKLNEGDFVNEGDVIAIIE